MANICLLVVKGNLRHRIEKLGMEKSPPQLSEDQAKLREIAVEMGFDCATPERPDWAGGAFVYLTRYHVGLIDATVQGHGLQLQSKHVLVSEEYVELVKTVLVATPGGSGREAFLTRRAGVIEKMDTLPVLFPGEQEVAVVHPDNKKLFLFGLPAELMETEELKGIDFDLLEYLTAPVSVQLMEPQGWINVWKYVCEEENEEWLQMRDEAYDEGPSITTETPWCTICSTWATVDHLKSDACRESVANKGISPGPLISAILKWAPMSSHMPDVRNRPVAADLTDDSSTEDKAMDDDISTEGPASDVCSVSGESLSSASGLVSGESIGSASGSSSWPQGQGNQKAKVWQVLLDDGWTDLSSERLQDIQKARQHGEVVISFKEKHGKHALFRYEIDIQSMVQTNMKTKKTRKLQEIEMSKEAGICPKPGCNLPAPGKNSATHCCKRCEAAHQMGVQKLHCNPLAPSEIWKKEHGPECTKHTGRWMGQLNAVQEEQAEVIPEHELDREHFVSC